MIHDKTNGHLDQVKQFAERTGQLDNLKDKLLYLGRYACNSGRQTRCLLFKDFAPESFEFLMQIKQEDEPDSAYTNWFNGGLIYHGPHDQGGDGSAPTFSVNLVPHNGWSVHT